MVASKNGRAKKNLMSSVKKHPLRTAGIAAGAVVGVALLRKVVNTASKVAVIKAAGGAVKDVAGAVRSRGGRKGARARGGRAKKSRTAPKA
jgi:hypothetical protein